MRRAKLNFTLRMAGFPPSVFSSVGYQGIVDDLTSGQMPRGGILGLGVLGPGNLQNGLLGALAGVGPAYRDAPFWTANSHLRTFGGVPDGNGNYVFTASVSEEYLTKDPVTGKTTHGYESFDQARTKLLAGLEKAGATDQGLVAMFNEIPADDPTYSTGDARRARPNHRDQRDGGLGLARPESELSSRRLDGSDISRFCGRGSCAVRPVRPQGRRSTRHHRHARRGNRRSHRSVHAWLR